MNPSNKNMMNKKTSACLLGGFSILGIVSSPAQIPPGLSGYTHYVELDPVDNTGTPIIGTVGSWSWEDSRLGDGVFWRHQSDWIAFNLTDTARVQIQVERNSEGDNSLFFPSFTLYSGFNDTEEGLHFASNTSNVQWVTEGTPSQELVYLMHHNNSTLGSIEDGMILPAGDYTILLGGNAVSEDTAVNVNYSAVLAASPIPEPSTSALGLLAGLGLALRRKR
jgi:hypothetical protein